MTLMMSRKGWLVYSSPVRWREKTLTAITHDSRDRYGFAARTGRNDGGGRNSMMWSRNGFERMMQRRRERNAKEQQGKEHKPPSPKS